MCVMSCARVSFSADANYVAHSIAASACHLVSSPCSARVQALPWRPDSILVGINAYTSYISLVLTVLRTLRRPPGPGVRVKYQNTMKKN